MRFLVLETLFTFPLSCSYLTCPSDLSVGGERTSSEPIFQDYIMKLHLKWDPPWITCQGSKRGSFFLDQKSIA